MRYLLLAILLSTSSVIAQNRANLTVNTQTLAITIIGLKQTNDLILVTNMLDGAVTTLEGDTRRNLTSILSDTLNPISSGVIADDGNDDAANMQKFLNAAMTNNQKLAVVPAGDYLILTALQVTNSIILKGLAGIERWGQGYTNRGVKFYTTGTNDIIKLRPPTVGDALLQNVDISGIQFIGSEASGNSSGIVFDLSGQTNTSISSVKIHGNSFANFPKQAIVARAGTGLQSIFNMHLLDNSLHDRDRSPLGIGGTNLMEFPGPILYAHNEVAFNHIQSWSSNSWGLKTANGTWNLMGNLFNTIHGSSSAYLAGGGSAYGDGIEGGSVTTNNYGYMIVGDGWIIAPKTVSAVGTGAQVGDASIPAGSAKNVKIFGAGIYNNNLRDYNIVAGGTREGTEIWMNSASTFLNGRAGDGVFEITIHKGAQITIPPGTKAAPSIAGPNASNGIYFDPTRNFEVTMGRNGVDRIQADVTGATIWGWLVVNTNQLVMKDGLLGIGTAAPSQSLTIQGIDGTEIGSILARGINDNPRFQVLNYDKDNVAIALDAAFVSGWKSGSENGQFLWQKTVNGLVYSYSVGNPTNSAVTWLPYLSVTNNGDVNIHNALKIGGTNFTSLYQPLNARLVLIATNTFAANRYVGSDSGGIYGIHPLPFVATGYGITNLGGSNSVLLAAGTNVVLTTNGNAIVINSSTTNVVDTDGYTLLPVVTTTDSTTTPIFTNVVANNTQSVIIGEMYALESGLAHSAFKQFVVHAINNAGTLTASGTSFYTENYIGADGSQYAVDRIDPPVGTSIVVTVDNNAASGTVKWKMRYKVVTHSN